jgi:hypothetical protein
MALNVYIGAGGTRYHAEGMAGLTYGTGWSTGDTGKMELSYYGVGTTINGTLIPLGSGWTGDFVTAVGASFNNVAKDLAKIIAALKTAKIMDSTFSNDD